MNRSCRLRAIALLLIPACSALQAAGDADPIEGVWDFTVTRRDCAGGAVLGTQKALSMFQRGGRLSNDNSTPPASHGAMFGSWRRGSATHSGTGYVVQMVFMRFNPDGTLAGTQRVQREMVLAVDGRHLAGSVSAQTLDLAGVVVQRGCADEIAVRVF